MLGYSTWAFGVQRCCLVTQRYYKSPLFLLIFFGEGIVFKDTISKPVFLNLPHYPRLRNGLVEIC
jgi:hypothetical protein